MRNKNFSAQKELLCLFRTFWQDKNTLNKNIGRIDYLYSKAEKIKILVKKSRISKILDFELESKSFFIAKIVGSYSRISRGYREHLTSWYFSGIAINDLFCQNFPNCRPWNMFLKKFVKNYWLRKKSWPRNFRKSASFSYIQAIFRRLITFFVKLVEIYRTVYFHENQT